MQISPRISIIPHLPINCIFPSILIMNHFFFFILYKFSGEQFFAQLKICFSHGLDDVNRINVFTVNFFFIGQFASDVNWTLFTQIRLSHKRDIFKSLRYIPMSNFGWPFIGAYNLKCSTKKETQMAVTERGSPVLPVSVFIFSWTIWNID